MRAGPFLSAVATLVLLCATANASWTAARHDAGRTGNADTAAATPPYSRLIRGEILGSSSLLGVLVQGQRFVVPDTSLPKVTCFLTPYLPDIQGSGPIDLEPEWSYTVPGSDQNFTSVLNHPALSGDRYIMGTLTLKGTTFEIDLRALNLLNGDEIWVKNLGTGAFAQYTVSDGVIYAIWEDDDPNGGLLFHLGAIKAFGPQELWTRDVTNKAVDSPELCVSGSRLFRVERGDSAFVAHDTQTGDELWRYIDTGNPDYATGTGTAYDLVASGDALFVSQGHRVFSLDAATGALRWSTTVGPADTCYGFGTKIVTDGNYVALGAVCSSQIVVLDADTGDEVWRKDLEAILPAQFTVLATASDKLYTVSRPLDSFLTTFRLSTGEQLDQLDMGPYELYTAMSIDNGHLYLGGYGNNAFVDVYETQPANLNIETLSEPACTGMIGGKLTFTYRVTNEGPGDAPNANVTVDASNADLDLQTPLGHCFDTGSLLCPLGTIPAGETRDLTLTVTPQTSGNLHVKTALASDVRDGYPNDSVAVSDVNVAPFPSSGVDLAVTGMEITQVVQDINNDMPLIEGKPTLVRIYVETGGGNIPGVNALLYGERDGHPLEDSPLQLLSPCGVLLGSGPDRTTLNGTLNFLLPRDWRKGEVTLTVDVNPDGTVPESQLGNNGLSQTVQFIHQPPICIVVYPVHTQDASGNDLAPNPFFLYDPALDLVQERALSLLPTDSIRYFPKSHVLEELEITGWGPYEMDQKGDKNKILITLWTQDQLSHNPPACNQAHARTHYMGVVDQNSAGLGTWGGIAGIGLDNLVVALQTSNTGTASFNNPRGGRTIAHELGHNYGRHHVNCGGPKKPDAEYPYNGCEMSDLDPNGYYGVDLMDPSNISIIVPRSRTAQNTLSDLMSYAVDRWPSDYTFGAIGRKLCSQKDFCLWPTSAIVARQYDPSRRTDDATLEADAKAIYQTGEQLLVAGTISTTATLSTLDLTLRLPPDTMPVGKLQALWKNQLPARLQGSAYHLDLVDSSDTVLLSEPFTPAPIADGDTDDQFVGLVVPYDSATAHIRLVAGADTVLAQRDVSPNAPTVTITAPTAGATPTGSLTIEWQGQDDDGDDLTYTVQYSHDNGATWEVLITGTPLTSYTTSLDLLAGGDNSCRVRVIASDGVNTGTDVSDLFTVATHDPMVHIARPTDGQTFEEGATVLARGGAFDVEDDVLSSDSLRWTLDGVGEVGRGEEAYLGRLAPGTYTLSLTATDSDSNTATDSVTVTVQPRLTLSLLINAVLNIDPRNDARLDVNGDGHLDAADVVLFLNQ